MALISLVIEGQKVLDLWHGVTSHPCHGFLPANFQLPMSFRSRLRVRRWTDRRTDRIRPSTLGI